jgi:choline dehydrogenase
MGTGPAAVVDPELNVIGTEGLRIADASVIPVIPTCNTQAPVIAIAERAVDLITGTAPAR